MIQATSKRTLLVSFLHIFGGKEEDQLRFCQRWCIRPSEKTRSSCLNSRQWATFEQTSRTTCMAWQQEGSNTTSSCLPKQAKNLCIDAATTAAVITIFRVAPFEFPRGKGRGSSSS